MTDIEKLIEAINVQKNSIEKLVLKLDRIAGVGGGGGGSGGGSGSGGGGGSGGGISPGSPIQVPGSGTGSSTPTPVPVNNQITDSLNVMIAALDKMQNVGKTAYGSLDEFAELGSKKYDNIQRMFGGIPEDVRKAQTEASGRAVRDVDNIYATFLGNDKRFQDLQLKGHRKGLNALTAFYDNEADVVDNYFAIRGQLAMKQSTKFSELSQEDVQKLSIMEKGFQISNQKVSQILERQIATTGEASTKIFSEISAFSDAVSKNSKMSYQEVAGQITNIITDVQRFGNVQVEEAARIAVALDQMGLSYEGFGGMIDNFMNFDKAAESLGNLTTVFGVHFDAMEMMQLANEDQEEFLHRMRDAFLDSGKAVEDMTLAEKKLAAQQMGMSIQDFENFMQEDREIDDLTSVTGKVDQKDIKEGFQTMTDQMVVVPKTAEEMKKQVMRKAMDPLSDAAYRVGQDFNTMKGKMILDPGKFLPGYTQFHTTMQQVMRSTLASSGELYSVEHMGVLDVIKETAKQNQSTLNDAEAFIKQVEDLQKKQGVTTLDLTKLMMSRSGSPEMTAYIGTQIAARQKTAADIAMKFFDTTKGREHIAKGTVPTHKDYMKIMKPEIKQFAEATQQGFDSAGFFGRSPSPLLGVPIRDGIVDAFKIDAQTVSDQLTPGLQEVGNVLTTSAETDLAAVLGLPADGVKSFFAEINSEEGRSFMTQQINSLNSHINNAANEMITDKDSVIGNLVKGNTNVSINAPNMLEKLQNANDKAILAAEAGQKASQDKADATLKALEVMMSAVSKALSKEATIQNVLEIDGKALAAQLMKIKVNDVGFKLTNAGGDSV